MLRIEDFDFPLCLVGEHVFGLSAKIVTVYDHESLLDELTDCMAQLTR